MLTNTGEQHASSNAVANEPLRRGAEDVHRQRRRIELSVMKKRRSHNLKARVDRSCRSLLASNPVVVVNIAPSGRQGMINYKSLKSIAPGKIGQAVCGIPKRWTIYLCAFCIDARGDR